MNEEARAILSKTAKVNKDKTNVIFCRVSDEDYTNVMKKRGRLQTTLGQNISVKDFVMKAIEAFVVD
jgi:hypothetical protein